MTRSPLLVWTMLRYLIRAADQRARRWPVGAISRAKASEEWWQTLPIEMTFPPDAVVEIVDQGPGIGADDRERIFREFEQLEQKKGSKRGTGLGLAISRRLAQALGGTLTVESELGKGSTFRLAIPERRIASTES